MMRIGELLYRIDLAGVVLSYFAEEDRLNAKPTSALTPALIEDIRQHKQELVQILREDEEMCHTGIIQSERQVFDMSHKYFERGRDDDL